MTRADDPAVLDVDGTLAQRSVSEHAAHGQKRSFARVRADAARLRRAIAASTCVMVAWSLFEVPWEFDASSSREETAAVIAAKTMLLLIAGLSLRGKRWARYLLLFVCLTSVLAIAPELPAEFERSLWLAFLSSVECLAKFALALLLTVHLRRLDKTPPMRDVAGFDS
jgi:hypothetical protein